MDVTETQGQLNDILYKVPDVGLMSYGGFTYFRQVWSDPRTGNGSAEIALLSGKEATPTQLLYLTAAYIETALKYAAMVETIEDIKKTLEEK
jgi:hypothetical protein